MQDHSRKDASTPIDSDALRANLAETAIDSLAISPEHQELLDMVERFRGIRNALGELLLEISHPFRNWGLIVPRLRAHVLKNIGHYLQHQRGPQAFRQFTAIFLQALAESGRKEDLRAQSMEALLAYVEKTAASLSPLQLQSHAGELAAFFDRLLELDETTLLRLVQGHHPMKKIAARLLTLSRQLPAETGFDCTPTARLLSRILECNYSYWLAEKDPLAWFAAECGDICEGWEAGRLFAAISHQRLAEHMTELQAIEISGNGAEALEQLLALPNHIEIVRLYKEVPEKLVEKHPAEVAEAAGDRFAENRKLLFLFRIMETPGLALIHEETLREINRSLVHLIQQQTFEEIERFLLTTFQLLKLNVRKYPHTSLQCIQVLGTEVFRRNNSRLVEAFLWETVRFGFQHANVSGVDVDWQPIANPAHLANIRVWLNLIMQEPKWCSTLFSALIINIMLTGTCVKDTDLFQRDITLLLNHPIEPIYNLFKQFAKLMPVFFNEIGAEGILRDVSTELDETHKRRDLLIHFLRKQSHVESSNLIVTFIEAIVEFWHSRDKRLLAPYLPEEVLSQVATEGPYIDELNQLVGRLFQHPDFYRVQDLLSWDESHRRNFLDRQEDIPAGERNRFDRLVEMYKLLHQKYNLGHQELRLQLQQAIHMGFPEMEQLLVDLEICDTHQCLQALLEHLEKLKGIILSDQTFEAQEDIYYKRHIAVDIPSVYGRYRERKFDALGLSFRLENLANIYLEKLPDTVNLSFITRATFIRIIKCLRIYLRALKVDGITSRRLDTYLSMLSSSLGIKRFSYSQYLDIFRGLSEGVKDVIYAYYTNIHQNNLSIIIPQIGALQQLLPQYRHLWDKAEPAASSQRLSETFLRHLIATTFGLQHLDNFITRIRTTLESQRDLLDEGSLDLLMTYNPERAISFLHNRNARTANLILLGNKGHNLTVLASDKKPVPPGFIITTEIFRCWPVVNSFSRARDELMEQIRHSISEIEKITGRCYGDPENPLLFSVRSGAAISMPGMMSTIHNVGLNEEIVEEFVRTSGKEYLAWDNYRRFLQSWAMTKGMVREDFQLLMDTAKNRHGVKVKAQFTPAQMKELALEYQKAIRAVGIGIPDDPWLQLIGAAEMVLASWNAKKTTDYRALMDASDAWGTAVIIQAMVYGNLGPESGSGVLFTAHPYRKVRRVALWGDYAPGDQGEDIVSGLVTTYPISVEQTEIDGRSPDNSLERRFPEIYETLLTLSRELVYEKQWNPQEIEFTFEGPKKENLFILQTRDMITIKKQERFNVFTDAGLHRDLLGKGVGVSGSALSGRAVFTADNITRLRREDPGTPLILIRQDTVPEDIKEVSMAEGLLTARGGNTSHAAVVATQLEKTCVVGCKDLKVYESLEYCEINGHTIRFGDPVALDGRQGHFLKGYHPVQEEVQILPI